MNNKLDNEVLNILHKYSISITQKKTILLLSANNIIIQIGILKKLQQLNKLNDIKIIIGLNESALLACLYIIGYTLDELYNIYTKQIDIIELFKNKNLDFNITFHNLYKKFNKKLIVIGTSLNEKKIVSFSHETFSDMKVNIALNISTTLIPYLYNNNLYIYGNCLCKYPIHLFKNEINDLIGIYINSNDSNNISTIISYLCNDIIIIPSILEYYNNIILVKQINETDPKVLFDYGFISI